MATVDSSRTPDVTASKNHSVTVPQLQLHKYLPLPACTRREVWFQGCTRWGRPWGKEQVCSSCICCPAIWKAGIRQWEKRWEGRSPTGTTLWLENLQRNTQWESRGHPTRSVGRHGHVCCICSPKFDRELQATAWASWVWVIVRKKKPVGAGIVIRRGPWSKQGFSWTLSDKDK